jgi:phospholipase C
VSAAKPQPEVEARSDRVHGELLVRLVNRGAVAASFELQALKYSDEPAQLHRVAAGAALELRLPLAASQHWYDYGIKLRELAGFSRRLAGHVETGEHSVSDPALGGPALLDQYRP